MLQSSMHLLGKSQNVLRDVLSLEIVQRTDRYAAVCVGPEDREAVALQGPPSLSQRSSHIPRLRGNLWRLVGPSGSCIGSGEVRCRRTRPFPARPGAAGSLLRRAFTTAFILAPPKSAVLNRCSEPLTGRIGKPKQHPRCWVSSCKSG